MKEFEPAPQCLWERFPVKIGTFFVIARDEDTIAVGPLNSLDDPRTVFVSFPESTGIIGGCTQTDARASAGDPYCCAKRMLIDRNHRLETERCLLRHITKEDIPHVFSATRFTGFNDGMVWDPPANEGELLQSYKNFCEAWSSGSDYVFTIETWNHKFIGRVGIHATDSDEIWSIGFWTHPSQQGLGYMTEVVPRILDFGFQELSAHEIEACHASWNEASKKVLMRCGMTWREHLPQGFKKRGEWVAEERLSITNEMHNKTSHSTADRA